MGGPSPPPPPPPHPPFFFLSSLLGLATLLDPTPVVLRSPLPAWQAWGACLGMTAIYVFSLYLLPAAIRQRPRDDPVHIRARFASVATACLVAMR